jgi:hypothetical protein
MQGDYKPWLYSLHEFYRVLQKLINLCLRTFDCLERSAGGVLAHGTANDPNLKPSYIHTALQFYIPNNTSCFAIQEFFGEGEEDINLTYALSPA